MADELITAIWDGPYDPVELPNGVNLHRGDEHQVTEGDLLSGHWKAKTPEKPRQPAPTVAAPAATTPEVSA